MSLRYALLGLLAHEPASGYGLTKYFERNVGRYAWHAKHTQIYPELNRLADEGCIEVVEEGPRGRRTYGLTDMGRDSFAVGCCTQGQIGGAKRSRFAHVPGHRARRGRRAGALAATD